MICVDCRSEEPQIRLFHAIILHTSTSHQESSSTSSQLKLPTHHLRILYHQKYRLRYSPIILRCLSHDGAIPKRRLNSASNRRKYPRQSRIYLHRDIRDLSLKCNDEITVIHTDSDWAASRSNRSDFLRWVNKRRELRGKWHVSRQVQRSNLVQLLPSIVIQFNIFI